MRTELFWLLSFGGFAAMSLLCGILVWPQLVAAWPSIEEMVDRFRRLPPLAKVALLVFIAGFIACGSTKTNQVGGVGLGLRSRSTMDDNILCTTTTTDYDYPPPMVTPEDIARGWQLLEVRTNFNISYTMPECATLATNWWLRGAYEDVKSFDFGDWRFPYGSNSYSVAWAFAWGKVRFALADTNTEIVVVGAPMSAVPYRSRFWSAADTNDSRLVTWENFALNRDTNTPVNAQIELRTTGDVVTRSNEVEAVYRHVDPEDWDGDGWRNDDDPDPYAWEEYWDSFWQELPDGANESTYCWIEIRPRWNSYIEFAGDGPSDLDDPYLWAKAGETYRVQLLIGKTYTIESTQPIDVVGRSSSSIEVDGDGTCELEVVWPVRMSALESNGSGFRMVVRPSGLGGFFNWTDSCCTVYGSDQVFRYGCSGNCGCSGCTARGFYEYAGYRLEATGGSCGCSSDDDHPGEDPDDPPSVGVSVSFSERAIIFEDSYANTTNDIVPWNSTATELTCTINGGPNGGYVQIDISGDDNLIQYTGYSLPYSRTLAPNERIEFTNRYKATVESSSEDDIEVTATFVENQTGWVDESEAKATAVRVEVEPATTKPGCDNRHVLGVGEVLRLFVFPASVSADITPESGWTRNASGGDLRFICPLSNSSNGLTVNVGGDSYVPSLQVLKPQSIVCRVGRVVDFGFPDGTASGIGMQIEPIIEPESVAFTGIRMMEHPTLIGATPPSGYFAAERYSDFWAHTADRGAGVWRDPNSENLFFLDTASFGEPCPSPWSDGTIDWDIEIGWGDKDAISLVDVIEDIPIRYHQITSISSDGGVKVEKFGQWVKRMPSGGITHSSGIRD